MTLLVELAAGSVIGAHHRRTDRANQDGWSWARANGCVVAAVADGCGSGPRSEVGACLGAALWARAGAARIAAGGRPGDVEVWQEVRAEVVNRLRGIATVTPRPERFCADHFLFTIVSVAVTADRLVVVAIGDGLVGINGSVHTLGPFPDNRPPYLGYELLGHGPTPVVIAEDRELSSVESAVIATDGASDLPEDELWELVTADRTFAREGAITRRLARKNRRRMDVDWSEQRAFAHLGSLADDTTIIALRRHDDTEAIRAGEGER